MIKKIPLIDKDKIVLYDIYINDVWYGSRSTIEQCNRYIDWVTGS